MPFKRRHQMDADWMHVMNRGARRQPIFLDDADRMMFLDIVAETPEHSDARIAAWCLMDNHYHFVVNGHPEELSIAMQRLSSIYTKRFNRRHGFDGPLFRGRFHPVEIESEAQLLVTVRYVHRNALDVDGVRHVDAYRWSSHHLYKKNAVVPRWMTTNLVLDLAGGEDKFARFVDAA